jgi:hypothetical protein
MLLSRLGYRAPRGVVLAAGLGAGVAGGLAAADAGGFATQALDTQARGYVLVQAEDKSEKVQPKPKSRPKTRRITPCGLGASVDDGCLPAKEKPERFSPCGPGASIDKCKGT